ncbi:MAG: hypothetical protein ACO2OZ_07930 [Acidilobaceae archaeon]
MVGTPGDKCVIKCYGCVADVNVYITVISVETLFPPLNLETPIPRFHVEVLSMRSSQPLTSPSISTPCTVRLLAPMMEI